MKKDPEIGLRRTPSKFSCTKIPLQTLCELWHLMRTRPWRENAMHIYDTLVSTRVIKAPSRRNFYTGVNESLYSFYFDQICHKSWHVYMDITYLRKLGIYFVLYIRNVINNIVTIGCVVHATVINLALTFVNCGTVAKMASLDVTVDCYTVLAWWH